MTMEIADIDFDRWYRVSDGGNPLCGADVKLGPMLGWEPWYKVVAVRRCDVFLGARPYQMRAAGPDGDLGLMTNASHLRLSPVQDEEFELATDNPYGDFIDEERLTDVDGAELQLIHFDNAVQCVFRWIDHGTKQKTSNTFFGTGEELEVKAGQLRVLYDDGEHDNLIASIVGEIS